MTKKLTTLDYPTIASVPAYAEAYHLYARFSAALAAAEADALALQAAWVDSIERERTQPDADRIADAQALIAGKHVLSHADKAAKCSALIASLKRAVVAQRVALGKVVGDLSAKTAQRFTDENKARTRRTVAALVELHAANESTNELHNGIEALGYSQRLPNMAFHLPDRMEINPFDPFGGYAPAWYLEAVAYVQTPAEREAAAAAADTTARKARAARVTAGELS